MRYNIEFQLISFLVLLIFAVVYFSKSRLKNIQNHIYGVLLVQSLLVNFMDMGSVIAIVHRRVAGSMTDFFAKGYLCTMVVWVATVSIYTLSLTGILDRLEKKELVMKGVLIASAIIILGVSLIIVMQDITYYSQGWRAYSDGRGVHILFGFGAVSVLFCFLTVLIASGKIPFIRRLSIYVYIAVIATTSIIQLWDPTLLLISAGVALSMVFMYFTLENPDMELIVELNEAKLEADRTNEAKVNFLMNMSHEIRKPVCELIRLNELILQKNEDSEVARYAQESEQACSSLLAIAEDIMDISKAESGKIEILPRKYLFCSMIEELYYEFREQAQKKGLEFYADIDMEYPRILCGDEARIRQIVRNLLSNAVKYTQEGTIRLTFSYQRTDGRKLDMIISVSDTGQGIKEEDKERLFDAFYRKQEEKERYIEGAGLGLTITKRLLDQMGGTLEVESVCGEGSTFIVHIPQEVVDETPIGEFEESLKADAQEDQSVRRIHTGRGDF